MTGILHHGLYIVSKSGQWNVVRKVYTGGNCLIIKFFDKSFYSFTNAFDKLKSQIYIIIRRISKIGMICLKKRISFSVSMY